MQRLDTVRTGRQGETHMRACMCDLKCTDMLAPRRVRTEIWNDTQKVLPDLVFIGLEQFLSDLPSLNCVKNNTDTNSYKDTQNNKARTLTI